MSFSNAWVFFVVLTFAIVALVLVFASSQRGKSGRSRERAERESGHTVETANRERPQNQSWSDAGLSGRDGPA